MTPILAAVDWASGLVVVVAVAAAIALIVWGDRRGLRILENWAADNGFSLLSREVRYLRRGPFFWTTSRSQVVYYVTVRDNLGIERRGWVRCGGWFLGLFSDTAQVR